MSRDWDANAQGLVSLRLKANGGLGYNLKKVCVGFVCLCCFYRPYRHVFILVL